MAFIQVSELQHLMPVTHVPSSHHAERSIQVYFRVLILESPAVDMRNGTTLATYHYKHGLIYQDFKNGFTYYAPAYLFWYQLADRFVVLCHTDCLTREINTPASGRFWTTMYAYDPPQAEVKRHERWLHTQFVLFLRNVSKQGTVPLPMEICEMIAQDCCPLATLRQTAADANRAFWEKYGLDDKALSTHTFNIATKAWARFVDFGGTRYIGCITNMSEDTADQQTHVPTELTLLHTPLPDDGVDTMYLVEDHLGIRDIMFASSLTTSEVHHNYDGASVWWKRLKIIPGTRFKCNTDVWLSFNFGLFSFFFLSFLHFYSYLRATTAYHLAVCAISYPLGHKASLIGALVPPDP